MFANIESTTAINFKERYTATTRNIWNLDELDSAEPFGARWFNLVPEEGLKVIEVTQLAWLTYTFTTGEALMPVKLQTIINVAKVSHEEKQGTDRCACSPFSWIAVNYQTVFRIGYLNINGKIRKKQSNLILLTLQPPVALLSYLEEEDEGWSMVIWPMIVGYSSTKESFSVICCSFWCINNVVFIVMFSIQKIRHLSKWKN